MGNCRTLISWKTIQLLDSTQNCNKFRCLEFFAIKPFLQDKINSRTVLVFACRKTNLHDLYASTLMKLGWEFRMWSAPYGHILLRTCLWGWTVILNSVLNVFIFTVHKSAVSFILMPFMFACPYSVPFIVLSAMSHVSSQQRDSITWAKNAVQTYTTNVSFYLQSANVIHLTVFEIWKPAYQLSAAFVLNVIMYSDVWSLVETERWSLQQRISAVELFVKT